MGGGGISWPGMNNYIIDNYYITLSFSSSDSFFFHRFVLSFGKHNIDENQDRNGWGAGVDCSAIRNCHLGGCWLLCVKWTLIGASLRWCELGNGSIGCRRGKGIHCLGHLRDGCFWAQDVVGQCSITPK